MKRWIAMAAAVLGLASGAAAVPATLAYDEAGNYEAGTFTNGANRGFGFGAWALTNQPADLGDSMAGGGATSIRPTACRSVSWAMAPMAGATGGATSPPP